MRTSIARLLVLAWVPLAVPGCAFNLACDVFGSLLQLQHPSIDVCGSFNGECCGDANEDGLPDECAGIFGAPPCGRFDTDTCFCTADGFGLVDQGQTLAPPPPSYTLPGNASFGVPFPYAGLSSGHFSLFTVTASELQTGRVVVTYPDAFGFAGFLALGPPGTQIGSYDVDVDSDFTADLRLPLRAIDADTAYVDGNLNGRADLADPRLVHTAGSHVFTTTVPRGGDGLAGTKIGRIPMTIQVALYAGLLTNPTTLGDYDVTASFTSVDPDSGDTDDATGTAPITLAPAPETVSIVPPPTGNLSPFFCYATKPTKGTLCAGNAAANAGGACASDAECGGTAGTCVKTPLPKGLAIGVEDQLDFAGPRTFTVAKPASLCAPAEVNGGGQPADAATHLRGYQVKPAKGAPPPDLFKSMPIVNALGTVVVDMKKPDRVLAVSAKALGTPAAALGPTSVDDFKCYTVKVVKKRCASNPLRKCKSSADCGIEGPCLGAFPKSLTAAVGDQFTSFGSPRTLRVVKPTRLCLAADVNAEGITNFAATLLCYATKPGAGTDKFQKIEGQIHTTNGLARERSDAVKESELCVPSFLAGLT